MRSKKEIKLPQYIDTSKFDEGILYPNSLTPEQNKELIESLKQCVEDFKNPDKWMTLEEYLELEKSRGFQLEA